MPTTISGLLSQVSSGGLISNPNGTQVAIADDVIVSDNATIDCTLYCKTLVLKNNVTFGTKDANGVTNRVIVYTYGNLAGWDGFGFLGYPGRAIIKTNGVSTIRNVTFIFKGGAGTETYQGSDNWDGNPPYTPYQWGYDGSTFQDLDSAARAVSLENVEFLHPAAFASNVGFWNTGSEVNFNITELNNVFIRNLYGVIFTNNPAIANNLTVVNSAWGVVAKDTDLTLTGLISDNVAVQKNSIFTLVDSQVQRIRWKKENSNRDRAGFSLRRTFIFQLQGEKSGVNVRCYNNGQVIFQAVTASDGTIPSQVVEWGYLNMNSANTFDNENISATNNKLLYSELTPSKFVRYKLPLDFTFSGYRVNKQNFRVAEINYTQSSILFPHQFLPVMVVDSNITEQNESVVNAYTAIATLSQLYDALKLYSANNPTYPTSSTQLATASGTQIDLGTLSLIIDATATQAIAVNQPTNTITIKSSSLSSSSKFSDLKTTGVISLLNGAIANFPYRDTNGISFKIYALPPKARVRITKVSDNSTIFVSANSDGEAIATLQPAAYIARADAFLYHRSEDVSFNGGDFSLRLPLTAYTDKNGVQINSINPVMAQVNLIRMDYVANRAYVTYSSSYPKISRDSLLYALEKFQSGYNPDIPGSQDTGLAINKPMKYQNEQFVFDSASTIKFSGESTNAMSDRPYFDAEIVHLSNETPWNLFDTSNGRCILLPVGQIVSPQVSGGFLDSDRAKLNAIPSNPLLTSDARLNRIDANISSRAIPSDLSVALSGGFLDGDRNTLNLLSTRIDAPISTRATPSDVQPAITVNGGFLEVDRAKLNQIPINPLLVTDTRINNLDATISSRATPANLQVTLTGGFLDTDRTKLNQIPSNPLLANDPKLNYLDANISSRSTPSDLQFSVSGGFTSQDRALLQAIPSNSALALLASLIEPDWSVQRLLMLFGAVLGGKSSGSPNNPQFRNLSDTQTIVSATINEQGDRSSVNHFQI